MLLCFRATTREPFGAEPGRAPRRSLGALIPDREPSSLSLKQYVLADRAPERLRVGLPPLPGVVLSVPRATGEAHGWSPSARARRSRVVKTPTHCDMEGAARSVPSRFSRWALRLGRCLPHASSLFGR